MRALPLLLLLAATPALAQQGPVDPDLVGTWALDFVESAGDVEDVTVESMTLTFTTDGRIIATGTLNVNGERRSETMEDTFTTANGRILASEGPPADYTFLGPDALRISDRFGTSIRFRRVSP